MPDRPLLQEAERYRAAILAMERRHAVRLTDAYGRLWQRLGNQVRALQQQIVTLDDADRVAGKIRRLGSVQSLRRQIEEELRRFAIFADEEISIGAREAIAAGLKRSEQMILSGFPEPVQAVIASTFNRLHTDAVETMLGFLADDSPLHTALTERLGPEVAQRVGDKLVEGIGLGVNPREVARLIRKELGLGLNWSLTTARTAQIWAYREVTRANYVANSHVVKGWTWQAALDDRTCMSCVAQDGTEHPPEDVLNGHHNCRCAAVPITKSWRELGIDLPETRQPVQTGREWFEGLSRFEQRKRMGPSMFKAWEAGEFDFADLSQPYTDPVYGEMLAEASLKGLLGDRAKQYYRRAA